MADKSKPRVYVNRFNGDVKYLNKSEARKLSEDWSRTEQIVSKDGERGMRVKLENATVDILENGKQEVVTDGNADSK